MRRANVLAAFSVLAFAFAAAVGAPTAALADPPSPGNPGGTSASGAPAGAPALAPARDALARGRYEEAESLARASARVSTGDVRAEAELLAARSLARRGKVDDALKLTASPRGATGRFDLEKAVLAAELLVRKGKRDDAERAVQPVLEAYNDGTIASTDAFGLALVGRAAHLLRVPKDANRAFNESEKAKKGELSTLLYRAALFLEKEDLGHAEEVLREALKAYPDHADAKVLAARVKLGQTLDFDAADKLVDEALASNPRLPEAFAVRAGLALRDGEIPRAEEALAKGLAVDPSHLELLSLRAAARFLDDDRPGFERAKAAVLALNPTYSELFTTVGVYAEWEHRYDDIVAMMKEAVKLDPDDGRAWGELGLTQLRAGDDDGGLASLRTAWKKDKYAVRVFNTLNLYEDAIAKGYVSKEEGVFRVRYPKDEQAVAERYVPRLLEEAYASMKARYRHVPPKPTSVELYATREHFSVRTSGLPNIGIQGVCFGRVLAALSPDSEPFDWGNVVWHELGHVFAIQLSKNKVPRWFTEGLSEVETIARRPEWAREMDPELFVAFRDKKIPSAGSMNRAFTHAESPEDVGLAYYASSQMMLFTLERWGIEKIRTALVAWGEGKKTDDVLRTAFGVDAQGYDAAFRAWVAPRLSRYEGQFFPPRRAPSLEAAEQAAKADPKSGRAAALHALALLKAGKGEEAQAAFQRAAALDPKEPLAPYWLTTLAGGRAAKDPKQAAEAKKQLAALRATGARGYVVEVLAARVADATGDKAVLRGALEAAHRADPSQVEPLRDLLKLAETEKREADLLPLLERIVQLDQHDRRAHKALLARLVKAKRFADARRAGELAVFGDLSDPEVHGLYAEALEGLGLAADAAFERESERLAKAARP